MKGEALLRWIVLMISHGAVFAVGFALGVYLLPILTAPPAPDAADIAESSKSAIYSASFSRNLDGSDFLHWGEGTVSITPNRIVHEGELAPGPDYKLYLFKKFVENEDQFNSSKSDAIRIADIKTFKGFIADVPDGIDVNEFNTVVVWCETFGEFITAAKYR